MARDPEELVTELRSALQGRRRLLAQGQAQSIIRRNGILPEDAPQFSTFLDNDLLNHSYALLLTSLDLLDLLSEESRQPFELDERVQLAQAGFIQASYALEAATRNASPTLDLAFHRLIAGAASHLAGYAARAFSLVQTSARPGRRTLMETTLADLITRDLSGIEERTRQMRTTPTMSDSVLLDAFMGRSPDSYADGHLTFPSNGSAIDVNTENSLYESGPVVSLLSEHYMSAVSQALFAIEHDLRPVLAEALAEMEVGERASSELNAPGPWWVYRLTRRLLGDLGETSILRNIPIRRPPAATNTPPTGEERDWVRLRRTFIASLAARKPAQIDLWPSQMHVVDRIFSATNDLVVALPTSAGKTRIAELCILTALAQGRRTVYVTPLRALSAQTEQILERSFSPLGARVSSLYGSMGMSDVDEDALLTSDIVITTPEKLDFALRSNPSVLDDVGLVVLDEGHMIGPSEREVRYEAQVQRLLRRADANSRRLVCLSAVFPSGEDLDDFVGWITDDDPNGLHQESWRPTRQRFGIVQWQSDHARLTMQMNAEDDAFIPRFIEAVVPPGKQRKNTFPTDGGELTVATAWRLVEEGQTVLIFCPQRNQVKPYAQRIVKLHKQGLIQGVLPLNADISDALAVGAEWFGEDDPIVKCLKLGVAIHHGALPGPFRHEVERLLSKNLIKVTVASPTLAQGLNLSASVVLFHGLRRGQSILTGSEFSNVIGRAGRAFVDTEGLVLYPLFEQRRWQNSQRRNEWSRLTNGESGKALRSGLIQIAQEIIKRVMKGLQASSLQHFIAYATGGIDWALPVVPGEAGTARANSERDWDDNLTLLDTSILSIVGGDETDPDQVTQALVDMLRDSLWERQLSRLDAIHAQALREVVEDRARFIWNNSTPRQRRGWYLAGVGARYGFDLGAVAPQVVDAIVSAENFIAQRDTDGAIEKILDAALLLFGVKPFTPQTELNWRPVLVGWLIGTPVGDLGADRVAVVQFLENDLTYRLVWGIEAARVYESAQGNLASELLLGTATAAIETGTLNVQASILMRSGFDQRAAAIRAVESIESEFESAAAMRQWVDSLPASLADDESWPTSGSRNAWTRFVRRIGQIEYASAWSRQILEVEDVQWNGHVPDEGEMLRVTDLDLGVLELWSPGFNYVGEAHAYINPDRRGAMHARVAADSNGVVLHYRGPKDLYL